MPGQAPALTDETALLLAYVAQQRDGVRIAAFGLTDEQARTAASRSQLTVGGLVKHCAAMLEGWTDITLGQDQAQDYEADFRLAEDETLADAVARLDAAFDRLSATVIGIGDLDHRVPVPQGVPWFPADVEAWSLRWVLLHVVEELARHAGHADVVREHVDGATAMPLMAAAEGWPATPWMQPWTPA